MTASTPTEARAKPGQAFVLFVLIVLLGFAQPASAQPDFPELTGRVVDNAGLLDDRREAELTSMLAAHESRSGEQVVIATLEGLDGLDIADYGYQLGRAWGIGDAEADTGALLLVAPNERAVRIEVGYGLEGRLTDARASTIINALILPAFREGEFAAGIAAGARAMVEVLGGDPAAVDRAREAGNAQAGGRPSPLRSFGFFVLMIVMIALFNGGGRGGGRRRRRRGFFGVPIMVGGGGFGGGLGGSGGFGGGGGGFGGGGASGGW